MFPNETQLRTDFLILGAGLAGCLMAWRLFEAGQSVRLIGDTSRGGSSEVAAGIINPVTGRWMTKTWDFDHLMPEARALYNQIEAHLGIQVFNEVPARRFCLNEADAKRANRRIRNPRYADVLGSFIPAGEAPIQIHDPFGSFEIAQAAYVDLPKLLTQLRTFFKERNAFEDQTFEYQDIYQANGCWHYQQQAYERILFCEGAQMKANPWFKDLPLKPIKGETLLLASESNALTPGIYHHEKWLLPYGDGTYRIGATYDEKDLSEAPTASAKDDLSAASEVFARSAGPFTPIKQLAGLRPSTPDTRPLVGAHPDHPELLLFNGLGSKGASVAPKLSKDLVRHLLENKPLNPEVALSRFTTV
ncbi:MAG: FAD-dependent oxidoreductase [Verrucomicrobiota bacterium]